MEIGAGEEQRRQGGSRRRSERGGPLLTKSTPYLTRFLGTWGRKSGHFSLRDNSINSESIMKIIRSIEPDKSFVSDYAILFNDIMLLYSIYSSVICRLKN
jgi:hypothetical protein